MTNRGEDGIALVVVLWVLVLLSMIAAVLSLEARTSAHIARNAVDKAAARAAADAGVQRAILTLQSESSGRQKAPQPPAKGSAYTWQFADFEIRISIEDQFGKINLNQAPEKLLAKLIESVGVDQDKAQSLAAAIADFRDPDDFTRPRGAEASEYKAAGLDWGPANGPFQTLEDLQQVVGMTPELYQRLSPNLTIYAIGASVDPDLAGEKLIGVIHQAGIRNFSSRETNVYSIRSEANSFTGASATREAVIQMLQNNNDPLILLWRQFSK